MWMHAWIGNRMSKKKMFIIGVHFDGNQIVYARINIFVGTRTKRGNYVKSNAKETGEDIGRFYIIICYSADTIYYFQCCGINGPARKYAWFEREKKNPTELRRTRFCYSHDVPAAQSSIWNSVSKRGRKYK